jgi:phage antirepressor YoqD-like protein
MSDLAFVGGDIASVLQQAVDTNNQLMAVISRMRAPAELGMAVMDDGECYTFAEAAKLLSPKLKELTGAEIGQNRLFDTLRTLGILQASESHRNEPYQQYTHHFKLVLKHNEHVGMKLVPLFTGKGLAWILPKLVEYYR